MFQHWYANTLKKAYLRKAWRAGLCGVRGQGSPIRARRADAGALWQDQQWELKGCFCGLTSLVRLEAMHAMMSTNHPTFVSAEEAE